MEDESTSLDGKGLLNMRVVDLKQELDKRGLSKSGSKKDLVKRLKQQLEFEKLCEERKSGDCPSKLELDAEIQQNEFVKQYLAQQQKRYAEREEEKRLEAMQSCHEESSTNSAEHESKAAEDTSSDTDDKIDEKLTLANKSFVIGSKIENTNLTSQKSPESDNTALHKSEYESKGVIKENTFFPHTIVSECITNKKHDCENSQLNKTDANQNIIQKKSNITEIDHKKLSTSKNLSKFETKNVRVTESSKEIESYRCIADNIDDMTRQKICEANIFNQRLDENNSKVTKEITGKVSVIEKWHNNSLTFEDVENTASCCTATEIDSREHFSKQSENMDASNCSSVPYSLSDIQLPESPSSHMKSKDTKCEERNQVESVSDEITNENSPPDSSKKSNGETISKLNSSQEDMSESETKDSSFSNDSPEKIKVSKRHSDESSDSESDRNSSPYKKKSFKYEDNSSNLAGDSDNGYSKDTFSKAKKVVKTQQNTDESDNEKSSDSEKYVKSKRKSHDKHRKRDRSSSSSSSKSSDISPEREPAKIADTTKSKDFVQGDEINNKSSDEKSIKNKKNDSATESSANPGVSIKKRLKIKRDNISIDIFPPAKESFVTSTADKSLEKNSSSNSNKPKLKQEATKVKEEKTEKDIKPPKTTVPLCYKLNRDASEENVEPTPKKVKWRNCSAFQKSSHSNSISENCIKNWFPDFKLISETAMEVEHDEHSLSAVEEKNDDTAPDDSLNENESSMKQQSTSQMDIEDSVSPKPNFEDDIEDGSASKILFIQNLVRPFTLNQLKDLLKQSGKIIEEYFWIDKIKSKCFVMYETEKEAMKARNSLNNTRWPCSNPKILSVEYSSIDELEKHQNGNESQPIKPPEPPIAEPSNTLETRVSHTVEEHKRKERERRKEKDRTKVQAPVREWDKDKIVQDSPERRPPREEKSRSSEKKEKKESKKKVTEETPAKLLDDLFQKTKSVPCIYWLPLTEEQAKAKDEERKMKRSEREKRNQQQKEQEDVERRRRARSSSRRREKENRKSSTRSRSPVSRRR